MDDISSTLNSNILLLLSLSAVLGLIIGSFLNVVIHRLPIILYQQWQENCEQPIHEPTLSLAFPGSHCPHCRHSLRIHENIPLLSFLLQHGKCRSCGTAISTRYPLVELITALLSVVVIYKFGFGAQGAAALLLVWALICLTFIDLDQQLLPDSITLPFLWLGLILSTQSLFVGSIDSIMGAAAGYGLLWSVFHLYRLSTGKEGLGYGDFKLLALLGAWLGWQLLPLVILLSSLCGTLVSIILIALRRHQKEQPISFGPYLASAGFVALIWGQEITDAYTNFLYGMG